MKLCDTEKCTACGACINACSKKCISYREDENGCSYPYIDENSCIGCGTCQRVCHVLNDVSRNYPTNAYAVWSNDQEDRKSSTSGGAASVFYNTVLKNGGVCFGATYDENLNVIIRGYTDSKIKEFKNSKYVHSDMLESYKEIRSFLLADKKVIFIGLPCQVAAIKQFLNKDYEKLILVDIICHGTPPIKHLREHIDLIEARKNRKAEAVRFREDNAFFFTLLDSNACFYRKHKEIDSYLLSFFDALNYYESCYDCKYACNMRVSDITIGDFWGLGLDTPFEHPYSGAVSLVLTNTDKGASFFETTKEKLFWEERPLEEAIKGNDQLNQPSKKSKNRESFLNSYSECGFEQASLGIYKEHIKKYKKILRKQEIENKIRNLAKKILRR